MKDDKSDDKEVLLPFNFREQVVGVNLWEVGMDYGFGTLWSIGRSERKWALFTQVHNCELRWYRAHASLAGRFFIL